MKLNPQQLDDIKAFIAKRGFKQADLQLELLDHVASRVEEKLGANPALGFEAALSETHREFGIFGFSSVEDSQRRALERQYFGVALAEGKRWLKLPKVLLLVGFSVLVYQAYFLLPFETMLLAVGVLGVALIGHLFVLYRRFSRQFKHTLIAQSTTLYLLAPVLLLQGWVQLARWMDQSPVWATVFTLLVLFMVFVYVSAVRVRDHALARCEELAGKYGDF